MQLKSLLKFACLAVLPTVMASDCNKLEDLDKDECNAEILIITTLSENKESNNGDEGFKSVVNTIKRFSVPAMQLEIPITGVDTKVIEDYLWQDKENKMARFNAVVFPNGRVSYSSSGNIWKSAIRGDQWNIFYDYAREGNARLVFLNEYPSNHTGTDLYAGQIDNPAEAEKKYKVKQLVTPESGIAEEEALAEAKVDTNGVWHFPAKIQNYNNGVTAEPLLYFEPDDEQNYPEKTIAAVTCENNGASYAGFFMGFGGWSKLSNALNVIWLSWATQKDFKLLSGEQLTSEDAINTISASDKTTKLEVLFVTLTTLFTIFATLF